MQLQKGIYINIYIFKYICICSYMKYTYFLSIFSDYRLLFDSFLSFWLLKYGFQSMLRLPKFSSNLDLSYAPSLDHNSWITTYFEQSEVNAFFGYVSNIWSNTHQFWCSSHSNRATELRSRGAMGLSTCGLINMHTHWCECV